MSYSIIGGADGPTSIFVAGNLSDFGWLNIFGMIIVIWLLIPNIIYARKYRGEKNLCQNKFMNILEQIGRYACMIFTIFPIGVEKFGFDSVMYFLVYYLGNLVMLMAYSMIWMSYFVKRSSWRSIALSVLPALIFLNCGIAFGHWLLIISAVVFGVSHFYVTMENIKKQA